MVKIHVLVDAVLRRAAHVRREAHLAVRGAAQELAEVGVEVGEESLLVGAGHASRGGVGNDVVGTTAIDKVDGRGHAVAVGGHEFPGEVWEQVDLLAFDLTGGENTRYADHASREVWVGSAGSCEVPNACRVDEQSQQGVLVGRSVVLQQGHSILVANTSDQ